MKAWHVVGNGRWEDDFAGHLLVYAETAGKAKSAYMASAHEPCRGAYTYLGCRRATEWDGLFVQPCVIYDNDELPEGAPPFYLDEEEVG